MGGVPRNSVQRSATSRSARASHVSDAGGAGVRLVCTVEVALTVIASCGSTTSKAVTWVPK